MGESMIIEGSANAVAFELYVEKILAPSLTEGQIVIMDNLAAHKGQKVEQLIEARGCQLLFLPGYSPDFSPTLVDVFQDQGVPATDWGQNARGPARSYRSSAAHRDRAGCTGLVSSLWVSSA